LAAAARAGGAGEGEGNGAVAVGAGLGALLGAAGAAGAASLSALAGAGAAGRVAGSSFAGLALAGFGWVCAIARAMFFGSPAGAEASTRCGIAWQPASPAAKPITASRQGRELAVRGRGRCLALGMAGSLARRTGPVKPRLNQ
jgi:hypothetical protein